jgi:hypothetical protein
MRKPQPPSSTASSLFTMSHKPIVERAKRSTLVAIELFALANRRDLLAEYLGASRGLQVAYLSFQADRMRPKVNNDPTGRILERARTRSYWATKLVNHTGLRKALGHQRWVG